MVNGSFLEFLPLPTVKVPLLFNEAVSNPDFILDTGFSGDLKVNQETATDLGIDSKDLAATYFRNANGQRVLGGLAHGFAELEGKRRSVEIIVADGPQLLGIKFLATFGYKAIVDCKNWECRLEYA
jgi:predicted aspartyl protease